MHDDIWNKYTFVEVQVYYTEARLSEVEQMRTDSLTCRMAEVDNKDFEKYRKELEKALNSLKDEVEAEHIEVKASRRDKDVRGFFGQIQGAINQAVKK